MSLQTTMDQIHQEYSRLIQTAKYDRCIEDIDKFIECLENIKNGIDSDGDGRHLLSSKIHQFTKQLTGHEKEIYSGVSKFGKSLDRTFSKERRKSSSGGLAGSALRGKRASVGVVVDGDAEDIAVADDMAIDGHNDISLGSKSMISDNINNGGETAAACDDTTYIDTAILMHLVRSGEFDVGSTFMNEAHVQIKDTLLSEFASLYEILTAIRNRNLDPAIQWASSKRTKLLARGSSLEFTLHKLQFINILQNGGGSEDLNENPTMAALQYARTHLCVFGDRYLPEISRLITSLLYNTAAAATTTTTTTAITTTTTTSPELLSASPYQSELLSPTYEEVHQQFASEFCSVLGLPPQSPLYLAVTAGLIAQPKLAKMESVMKLRKAEWSTTAELPISIELPSELQFHSIFVCPVSKEQATEENPPMMLGCGHVLGKNSIKSLARDDPSHLFKCPYCPQEASFNRAQRIYF